MTDEISVNKIVASKMSLMFEIAREAAREKEMLPVDAIQFAISNWYRYRPDSVNKSHSMASCIVESLLAAGYVIAPVEPTENMVKSVYTENLQGDDF